MRMSRSSSTRWWGGFFQVLPDNVGVLQLLQEGDFTDRGAGDALHLPVAEIDDMAPRPPVGSHSPSGSCVPSPFHRTPSPAMGKVSYTPAHDGAVCGVS